MSESVSVKWMQLATRIELGIALKSEALAAVSRISGVSMDGVPDPVHGRGELHTGAEERCLPLQGTASAFQVFICCALSHDRHKQSSRWRGCAINATDSPKDYLRGKPKEQPAGPAELHEHHDILHSAQRVNLKPHGS